MEEIISLPKKKVKFKKKFIVEGVFLGDSIDLKRLQEKIKHYPFLTREPPLLLRFALGQYIVITKFGVVVFWNIKNKEKKKIIQELSPFVENFSENREFFDSLKVFIVPNLEKVKFGKIFLSKLDKEKLQIISFVLAQSVALEKYEIEIEERLKELEKVIEALKKRRWFQFKEKEILAQIGEILAVKQKAISHLSLFDKPATTWEREDIEKLYHQLAFEFELEDRFDVLNEKIKFLSDHHKTLLDFISAQRGNFLELIIVILIVIELLIFLGETLLKLKF